MLLWSKGGDRKQAQAIFHIYMPPRPSFGVLQIDKTQQILTDFNWQKGYEQKASTSLKFLTPFKMPKDTLGVLTVSDGEIIAWNRTLCLVYARWPCSS